MASEPASDRASIPPLPRDRLVGRAGEVVAARTILLQEAVPLLTLTGPGGVGKTRLALAVAHEVAGAFADGVAFVDLAPLADPTLVLPTVAQALGVPEGGDRPLAELVRGFLRPRQLLLVLDNCEHLLAAVAAVVGDLLAACPALQVLATESGAAAAARTSRNCRWSPWRCRQARPPGLAEAAASPAVALFVRAGAGGRPGLRPDRRERGRRRRRSAGGWTGCRWRSSWPRRGAGCCRPRRCSRGWATGCSRWAGGRATCRPASRRCATRSPGATPCSPTPERAIFRRLAVFVGGFTLEAAEAVGPADGPPGAHALAGVGALVDQSLLRGCRSAAASRASGCWRRSGRSGGSNSGERGGRRGARRHTPPTTSRWRRRPCPA